MSAAAAGDACTTAVDFRAGASECLCPWRAPGVCSQPAMDGRRPDVGAGRGDIRLGIRLWPRWTTRALADALAAMHDAGFTGLRHYVGGWSQWSANPHNPVERGDCLTVNG